MGGVSLDELIFLPWRMSFPERVPLLKTLVVPIDWKDLLWDRHCNITIIEEFFYQVNLAR